MATTNTATSTNTNPAADIYSSLNGKSTTTTNNANSMGEAESRFLKLLTTQMKNQDPLNPLDNAQVTSQLAQISTVNGIEKLNTTLSQLIDGQAQSQALQAASLVGHGVLVAGNAFPMANGTAVAGFELEGGADKVTITIKDANGVAVRTLTMDDVDAGVHPFAWDGKNDDGAALANGEYSFDVTATQGNDKVKVTKLQYGVVNSVAGSATGVVANLGSLGKFGMNDIKQIL